MTEERKELPSGYFWKRLPYVRAEVPMPEGWFSLDAQVGDTRSGFITRESIRKNGIFQTGLSINVLPHITQSMGISAVDLAKGSIRAHPYLTPLDEFEEYEDNDFLIARRLFRINVQGFIQIPNFHGELVLARVPESNIYLQMIANRNTDSAYVVQFETPERLWEQDKETAELMIKEARFNPNL